MNIRKIEITVVLILLGWLASASMRAGQIETKVDIHDQIIKVYGQKIDKISDDTNFIRGMMERKQGE